MIKQSTIGSDIEIGIKIECFSFNKTNLKSLQQNVHYFAKKWDSVIKQDMEENIITQPVSIILAQRRW